MHLDHTHPLGCPGSQRFMTIALMHNDWIRARETRSDDKRSSKMREFNASDGHWKKAAPVSPELELGDLLEQILIRYAAEAEGTLQEAKVLKARKRRDEDARKRSLSAKFVTTPNSSQIYSRRTIILREMALIRPLVLELLERIATVELARIELREYTESEEAVRRERDRTGSNHKLPKPTLDFVDTLFHNFRIDGATLSSLEGGL